MKGSIKCPWCGEVLERQSYPEKNENISSTKRIGTFRLFDDFVKHMQSKHQNIIKWEEL